MTAAAAIMICVFLSFSRPAASAAPLKPSASGSALIIFVSPDRAPAGTRATGASPDDAPEGELGALPSLSIGIMSATQGAHTPTQVLLDLGQGARISYSSYGRRFAPGLTVTPTQRSSPAGAPGGRQTPTPSTAGAVVQPWSAVQARASDAPETLQPGLLASTVPGGAGYAGVLGQSTQDAVAAARRNGRIAAFSVGPA